MDAATRLETVHSHHLFLGTGYLNIYDTHDNCYGPCPVSCVVIFNNYDPSCPITAEMCSREACSIYTRQRRAYCTAAYLLWALSPSHPPCAIIVLVANFRTFFALRLNGTP